MIKTFEKSITLIRFYYVLGKLEYMWSFEISRFTCFFNV